jgi:hypothetical protein
MNTNKNSFKHKWIIYLTVVTIAIALCCTSILGNVFSLIIEKEYFIPEQSSIFTFSETIGNEGSSDVWRYGEDYSNYYFNLSTFDNDVLFFSKKKISSCPGFNPEDVTTWCEVNVTKY